MISTTKDEINIPANHQVIEHQGEPVAVVVPYAEYAALEGALAAARAKIAVVIPYAEYAAYVAKFNYEPTIHYAEYVAELNQLAGKPIRKDDVDSLAVRKPNRLKDYDYSQNGAYFITICTKDRREILGEIINGQPILNEYGSIVKREIENISAIRKECVVENFIVMPNHIHLIVQILLVGDDGNRPAEHRADCHPPLQRKTISNMVQGLKGAITKQIGFPLWQRSFYDRIIRNDDEYNRIAAYMENNPVMWADDQYYIKETNSFRKRAIK